MDPAHDNAAAARPIAVVADGFDPARGGAERVAAQLVAALRARGHTVETIEPPAAGGALRRAIALASAAQRARAQGRFVVSLCKAPGDLVCPQGGLHLAAMAGALEPYPAALRPVLGAARLLAPRQFAFLAAERRQYAQARHFVAISERVRQDMIRIAGVPPERIEVCRLGVDLAHFRPPTDEARRDARRRLGLAADALVLLFASHNYRLRGLGRLLRALAQIEPTRRARLGLTLLVAGRGERARLQRLAHRLEIALVAAGQQSDMRAVYHAADALVHPTFYDTSSLVILEAMACGLPVVTTAGHGGAEFLRGPESVLVPPGRDPAPLARAIERLFEPGARRALGRSARACAERYPLELSLARLVDRIEDALLASAPPETP
ncbi:MAG: glycosyltransferase [Planctomycetota bacterium]|nr:MAG: glycosyltransferase [Planctomycetota bacterium]